MWEEIREREAGTLRPFSFCRGISSRRIASLALSNHRDIISPHHGAINSLQVDLTEHRYLLSGASDGSTAVFDMQNATDYEGGGLIAKHRSLFVVDKQHDQGHQFAVSSAIWYPVDTGLFITASFDHYVKVWDTNSTQVVMVYKMPGKVYGTGMSEIAKGHMLIAVGSADVQVRLCDIASGAFTHTLSGHRDGVMSVEWSKRSEWVLMTGGCDGAIRFWDIRRAGSFLVLDQSISQLGRRPPLLPKSASNDEASSSKPSSSSVRSRSAGKNQSLTSRKSQGQSQNQGRRVHSQRLHPGMSSSQSRSTAHYGAVTSLRATPDGFYLLSSGSDSRLRLWDIESGSNTLVNYEAMRLQTTKPLQLALTPDSSLVFVPSLSSVKAYDVWSGMTVRAYRAHYELVNCCFFNMLDQELYTGSNDRQILVWSPSSPTTAQMEEEDGKKGRVSTTTDQDYWSD